MSGLGKRAMAGIVSVVLGVGFLAVPMTTAHAAPTRAASASTSVFNHRAALTYTNTSSARAYAGGPPPLMIGVDAAAPDGKNWEYTHYFPESGVSVAQGGVILFSWNQADINGLHSVTIAPSTLSLAAAQAQYPVIVSDSDNGEVNPITPPKSNNPTDPTCSTGPAAPPCTFSDTGVLSSGIIPSPVGAVFAVKIAPTVAPGTYHYFCIIHRGMVGSFDVVPAGGTDPNTVAQKAAAEKAALDAGAAAAEAAHFAPTSTANANGTRNWHVFTGFSADDVELLEYLPPSVPIKPGDTVTYDTSGTSQEIHTASTPASFEAGLVPFPQNNDCETATGPDTAAQPVDNGPPQLGCSDPNNFESPLIFPGMGPSVISSAAVAANSGILSARDDFKSLGAVTTHTDTFPNEGTYYIVCAFHQGMAMVVDTPGYRLAGSDAGVYAFGGLTFHGSQGGQNLASPVVAMVDTVDNQGYWLVTADGHTANFGGAPPVGNVGGKLAAPIVGGVATPRGGLILAAKDGGIFNLGAAPFFGSLGGVKLAAPVVGISANLAGGPGYDLVAADGGVFTFAPPAPPGGGGPGGPAPRFFGSLGGVKLAAPIVGMVEPPTGDGYTLVASDGGVFNFGPGSLFFGSLGGTKLAKPIVGLALTGDFHGYRMVAADGGVFDFGDAAFFGSLGGLKLGGPIIGIGAT